MRIPLPKNTLVSLTIVGAILVAAVSISLAFPGTVPGMVADDDSDTVASLSSDAPTPNPDFTPAVQTQSGGEHEDDEYEEHDEDDEYDDEEHDSLTGVLGALR